MVCDPDGKNQKTIASEKGWAQWLITIGHADWGFVAEDAGKQRAKADEEKIQGTW